MGRWGDARRATERALAAAAAGPPEPALALMHARALARTGDPAARIRALEALASRMGEADPVGREARRTISELSAARARKSGPIARVNP